MYLARFSRSFPFSRVANGSVVTIGAFDGLHLGHRQLLNRVLEEASTRDCPAVVMSFEPTPKEYFSARSPPARLTRFRDKFAALRDMGIDIFYCPAFNLAMRNIAADAFIRQLLVHTLNVRHLVIGDDFVFAKNRQGNLEHLQQVGRAASFSVEQVPSVIIEGDRISSTAIRDSLRDGDMVRARRLLGNYYHLSGKITTACGDDGDTPIILIAHSRRLMAVQGIFAVKVRDSRGGFFDGVACCAGRNLGGDRRSKFAIYVPEINQVTAGEYVDVEFIARLGDETPADSVAELAKQLAACASEARVSLAAYEAP